ncbi:hypothetical protein [Pararhodobacter zhoushanensis]|uniref:Uncharacterized protein n=1 Tax=Pararhodobacter zhoushanensis TaxID=2479545 RepID=A0ABT3H466_9RHOB|nr:hypothetical protein [Pararhodobacter zhoushanensis]MCW1934548.1 hypothetical protein [Pararhodobacter zhoushanensis]
MKIKRRTPANAVSDGGKLVNTRTVVPPEIAHIVTPAPARGLLVVGRERRADGPGYVTGPDDDGTRLRLGDVFDRMESDAIRHDVPFFLTPGQVSAGRRFRDTVEGYSAGLSPRSALASMQPLSGGGSGAMSAMDWHLMAGRRYDGAVNAIGHGVSLAVRRVRPSTRGGPDRRSITDRALVDAVALYDLPLEAVLVSHGWAKNGVSTAALKKALSAALERLRDVL